MEMFYSSSSPRIVKKYLDEATTESVLEDLNQALTSYWAGAKDVWNIFFLHSFQEGYSHYWDVESLRQFLARWHPGIDSHETTYLLWGCLHFYAHYPFARSSRGSRIDVKGFQRAIALLVFRGTDSLGTQQRGDHYWRYNEGLFREADFRRMLRSISQPAQFYAEEQWTVDDVMGALVTTLPYSMTLVPSSDQLREAAERILPGDLMGHRLFRDEFSLFVRLLLQLRVQDVQGSYLPSGLFNDGSSSACQELADRIADAICNDDQTVDAGIVADVLPGLRERFYSLWGVIFQPRCPRETIVPPEERLPNHILAAVSLLLPLAMDASGPSHSSVELLPRTEDLGMDFLLKQIRGDDYPHILLFTDETCTAVIGAYIPHPSSHEAESQSRNSLLDASGHFLFQLCPKFCLLRSTGLKSSPEELFSAELNASSLEKTTTTDQGPSPSYSIGYEGGARLRVDPQDLTVNMAVNLTESREGNMEQELTVHPAQLHILRINPSASTVISSRNGSKEAVSGEELRNRIHGFGSSNSETPSPNMLERWNIRRQFYGGTCP